VARILGRELHPLAGHPMGVGIQSGQRKRTCTIIHFPECRTPFQGSATDERIEWHGIAQAFGET